MKVSGEGGVNLFDLPAIESLKGVVLDTWLERPLRFVWRVVRPRVIPRAWERRILRDDRRVERLLRGFLHSDARCLDIGAHSGSFLRLFQALAPQGAHVAIEALPELTARLRRRFPDVQVIDIALGETSGKSVFYYVKGAPAFSGLREQDRPGGGVAVPIKVEIRRLDELDLKGKPFDFVKIDVEGAEYSVLRGGEKLIRRDRPLLLIEHARIHCRSFETTPHMIYDLLDGWNFALFTLTLEGPLSRNRFTEIVDNSAQSEYGLSAETNFLSCHAEQTDQLVKCL